MLNKIFDVGIAGACPKELTNFLTGEGIFFALKSAEIAADHIKKYNYPWDLFCRVMRGDKTFVEIKERLNLRHIINKLLYHS